ncbi:MAG: hypothetical protein R3B68_12980 [Phycisphaerales bacterium]
MQPSNPYDADEDPEGFDEYESALEAEFQDEDEYPDENMPDRDEDD